VKGRTLYRVMLILPWAVPAFISAFAWKYMFNAQYGIINQLLRAVGLPDPVWLGQSDWALFAVIVVNVWLGVPFMMVALLGGLQSIPGDLYEAAEMDGANWWQKFRTVTIPFLRPAMLPYAIYGFVITFNLFSLSYFMTAGEPFGRTEILVTQAYKLAQERQLFGVAAAFSVYLFFLLLAVTLVTNRLASATKSYAD
jgi:arabinogalactan oligomer/maltooligosaccharide transport system permease protein